LSVKIDKAKLHLRKILDKTLLQRQRLNQQIAIYRLHCAKSQSSNVAKSAKFRVVDPNYIFIAPFPGLVTKFWFYHAIDKDFVLKFAEAPRAWIAIKYNFDDIQKTTCVNKLIIMFKKIFGRRLKKPILRFISYSWKIRQISNNTGYFISTWNTHWWRPVIYRTRRLSEYRWVMFVRRWY